MAGLDTLLGDIKDAISLSLKAGGSIDAQPNEFGYYDNPGNIESNTSAPGSTGGTYNDGRFAVFDDKVSGLHAIPYTLTTPYYDKTRKGNIINIEEAMKIYKPIGEDNSKEEVMNQITDIQTIIGSNNLDLSNKDHVMALLESVVKFENKNNEKALNYYDIDSRDKAADLFISSFTK